MIFKFLFEKTKAKHSKAEAGYVGHTVKGQRCDGCTMWIKGGHCTAVSGVIAKNGWCKWWKKSQRKAENK